MFEKKCKPLGLVCKQTVGVIREHHSLQQPNPDGWHQTSTPIYFKK